MKHFSLGLAVGAGFGVVLSLFKDKNGNRLFPSAQKQINSVKEDFSDLSASSNNLKIAKQKLKESLPQAKNTISELEKEVEYYQIGINRIIAKLKSKASAINRNIENEADNSKN